MLSKSIRSRLDKLHERFNRDPAYILVTTEDGEEKKVTVDEYLAAAKNGDFSLHFVKMLESGTVEDAVKVLNVLDLWLIAEDGRPGAICSEEIQKWWHDKTDADRQKWRENYEKKRETVSD